MKLFFYPACKPEPDHSHPLPHMPIPSVPPPLVPTSFPWWPWPSPATSCLGHMPWPSSGNIFWVCFCLERVGHRFIRLCRRIFLSIFLYLFCHILYSSFSFLKPLFQVYKHGFCTKWKAGERDKYEQVNTHENNRKFRHRCSNRKQNNAGLLYDPVKQEDFIARVKAGSYTPSPGCYCIKQALEHFRVNARVFVV